MSRRSTSPARPGPLRLQPTPSHVIRPLDAANAWLRETYILAHNARVAAKVDQEGSAFVRQLNPRQVSGCYGSNCADPPASSADSAERCMAAARRTTVAHSDHQETTFRTWLMLDGRIAGYGSDRAGCAFRMEFAIGV
jgi:hypothetical protein